MLVCYAAIEMRTHSTEKLLKPLHLYTEHLRISTTQLHSTLEEGVNTSHVDFWGSTLPSREACLELFKQQQGIQQGRGQQRTRHGGVRPVVQGLAGCSQDSAFTPSKMENHWRTVSRAVIGSHWHSKISLAARLMTEWMNELIILFCFVFLIIICLYVSFHFWTLSSLRTLSYSSPCFQFLIECGWHPVRAQYGLIDKWIFLVSKGLHHDFLKSLLIHGAGSVERSPTTV